jgi:hypothetical protein
MQGSTIISKPWHAAAALAILFAVAPALGGGKGPAPYELAVAVVYGDNRGSESVREWAEREIVREIDEADCFVAAQRFRADDASRGDLLLRVVVDDFEEKTDYETTLARRDNPNAPPTEHLRLIANLEIWGRLELWTLPDRQPVRDRTLHLQRGYRPALGEDPDYEVRRLLIEALSEEVRRWTCKGARKKLPEEIERARAGSAAAR